jgi:hypothetical protein
VNLQKSLSAHETELLCEALSDVLHQLIRPLVGSVSLERLEEIVRTVFLREAEALLRKEYAGRPFPVSQMALLTGMETKMISKSLKLLGGAGGFEKGTFATTITPMTHLLDRWSTEPGYQSDDSSQPRVIPIFGEKPSIEALMDCSRFPDEVTPRSVADRLILSGAAREQNGFMSMITEKFMPNANSDVDGAIESGFHSIKWLINTVMKNLGTIEEDSDRLYQRAFWTNRLSPDQQDEFRGRLRKLMTEFQDEAIVLLGDFETNVEMSSQITSGFGLYYFEMD